MNFTAITTNLIVESVNQSIKFYEDVLGFVKIVSMPADGEYVFAIMQAGGVSLMLQTKQSYNDENPIFASREIGGTFVLYINVDNVHELLAKIKDQVEVVAQMHKTCYNTEEFSIKDNNGYVLTFSQDIV